MVYIYTIYIYIYIYIYIWYIYTVFTTEGFLEVATEKNQWFSDIFRKSAFLIFSGQIEKENLVKIGF